MFFSYKNGQVKAILVKTHFDAPTDPVFKNIGILKFHGLQLLNCLCVELLSNTFLFFLSFFFYQGPKFYNTSNTDIANAASAVAII